jgi:alpha-tubulin suppressor-like RCC1 family protein
MKKSSPIIIGSIVIIVIICIIIFIYKKNQSTTTLRTLTSSTSLLTSSSIEKCVSKNSPKIESCPTQLIECNNQKGLCYDKTENKMFSTYTESTDKCNNTDTFGENPPIMKNNKKLWKRKDGIDQSCSNLCPTEKSENILNCPLEMVTCQNKGYCYDKSSDKMWSTFYKESEDKCPHTFNTSGKTSVNKYNVNMWFREDGKNSLCSLPTTLPPKSKIYFNTNLTIGQKFNEGIVLKINKTESMKNIIEHVNNVDNTNKTAVIMYPTIYFKNVSDKQVATDLLKLTTNGIHNTTELNRVNFVGTENITTQLNKINKVSKYSWYISSTQELQNILKQNNSSINVDNLSKDLFYWTSNLKVSNATETKEVSLVTKNYVIYLQKVNFNTAPKTTINVPTLAPTTTIGVPTVAPTTLAPTTTFGVTTLAPTTTIIPTTTLIPTTSVPTSAPVLISYVSNYQIMMGQSSIIIINGVLYTSGLNDTYQLGMENTRNKNKFSIIPNTLTFTNSNFISVDGYHWSTRHFFMAVKNNGDVYGSGYIAEVLSGNWRTLWLRTFIKVTKLLEEYPSMYGKIKQISTANYGLCAITDTNEVYVSGQSRYGRFGTTVASIYYEKVLGLPPIIMGCCTNDNTTLLSNTGKLYSCGRAATGLLGNNTNTPDISTFTLVPFVHFVKLLHCKFLSSGIITSYNILYVCGNSASGHLGTNGVILKYTLMPNSLTFQNNDIKMVRFGQSHTLILKNNGELYSCGQNYYGQLGLGNNINTFLPTRVTTNGAVEYIGCGYSSSGYYMNGQMYTFGQNTDGQLGLGHTNNVNTPTPLDYTLLPQQAQITTEAPEQLDTTIQPIIIPSAKLAGSYYSILYIKNNILYAYGSNIKGQLGLGQSITEVSELTKVPNMTNVRSVVCGYKTSYIITNDDKLYTCGLNDHGQLGLGNTTNQYIPTLVNINNVSMISTSDKYSDYYALILSKDGSLYIIGQLNSQHNIGGYYTINSIITTIPVIITKMALTTVISGSMAPVTVPIIRNIKMISSGHRNTLMLTTTGLVYSTKIGHVSSESGLPHGSYLIPIKYLYNKEGAPINLNDTPIHIDFISAGSPTSALITADRKIYVTRNQGAYKGNMFTEVSDSDSFKNMNIVSVSCSSNLITILKSNGKVYFGSTQSNITSNTVLSSAFVTDDEKVYIFNRAKISESPQLLTISNTIIPLPVIPIIPSTSVSIPEHYYSKIVCTDTKRYVIKNNILYTYNTSFLVKMPYSGFTNDNIKMVTSDNVNYFAVVRNNQLYVAGSNVNGQLGFGHNNSVSAIQLVPNVVNGFTNGIVKMISMTENVMFILTTTGKVYSCGNGINGNLGLNNMYNYNIPTLTTLENIKTIDCNNSASYAITNDNKLYECGSYDGQYKRTVFTYVADNVLMISSSDIHAAILKTDKKVYIKAIKVDANTSGVLGNALTTSEYWSYLSFILMEGVQNVNIKMVKCHRLSTTLLSEDGKVYVCGMNNFNNLGLPLLNPLIRPLTLIPNFTNVDYIANRRAFFTTTTELYLYSGIEQYTIPTLKQMYATPQTTQVPTLAPIIPIPEAFLMNINIIVNDYAFFLLHRMINRESYKQLKNIPYSTLILHIRPLLMQPDELSSISSDNHTQLFFFAIRKNGDVYGYGTLQRPLFGANENRSNAINETINYTIPTKLFSDNSSLNGNVRQILTDKRYACLVTLTNEAYVVGSGLYGSLGNGNMTYQETYTKILGLDPISMCAIGNNTTILLTNKGKLYSTGRSAYGLLGNATTTPDISTFTLVNFTPLVKLVYAHSSFSLVITTDNKLYICGSTFGIIGLPGKALQYTLIPNSLTFTNTNIKKIAMGSYHILILKHTGELFVFGNNTYGQLGKPQTIASITSPALLSAGPVDEISASKNSSVFCMNEIIYVFGDNAGGPSNSPQSLLGISSIALKIYVPTPHLSATSIVRPPPTIAPTTQPPLPTYPPQPSISSLIAIDRSSFMINGGILYSTGVNGYYQLGFGNTKSKNIFTKIPNTLTFTNNNIISVITSTNQSNPYFICLNNKGEVYGCGKTYYKFFGESGISNMLIITTKLFTTRPLLDGKIIQITSGYMNACVVTATNEAYMTGHKQATGNVDEYTYIKIEGLPPIKMAACSGGNTFLLTTLGDIYIIGSNYYGLLGDGGVATSYATFTKCIFNKSVKLVYAYQIKCLAITTENKIYCLGYNVSKQFGSLASPIKSFTLIPNSLEFINEDIKMASLGDDHLLILKNTGKLYCCGTNTSGELGIGHTTNITSVKLIPTGTQIVTHICAGGRSSSYYTNDGKMYVFGHNGYGQLGLGHNTINITVPTQVTLPT